jgi:predicted component of type VI protein secretion system
MTSSERSTLERKLKRLQDARFNYGVQAMNAMTNERFIHFEKMAALMSERIWDIETQLSN